MTAIAAAHPHARARKKRFNRHAKRRREIERHGKDTGAADSDDLSRWLMAWHWHNGTSKDPTWAIAECARRLGRRAFTVAEAEEVLDEASHTRRHMSADRLAQFLGVTPEQRQRLRLTTIGAVGTTKAERKAMRKERNRLAKERKRREQGVRPQAESLSRTQPWVALGMSRPTWYRRGKPAAARETVSGTADSYSAADEVVSR